MPDSKPYRDSPGFIETDNGIVADPSVAGSAGDYNSWDWKQIMAAINGGSAMSGDGGNPLSQGLVDPQTLWDAGRAFDKVKNTLQMVGKSISDQSKALAGPDGPWKGDAATAFMTLMDKFSQQVLANAERFSGGDAGINPVGTQLWNMGNQLSYAQYQIHAIDSWYAHQASLVGASTMDNGLIHIGDSKYDKIREMMTKDMRQVLHDLADKYAKVKVNPPATGGGSGGKEPPPYNPEKPPPYPLPEKPPPYPPPEKPPPYEGPGAPPPYQGPGAPPPYQPPPYQGPGAPPPQQGGGDPPPYESPGPGPQAQDFPGGGPQPQAFASSEPPPVDSSGGGPQPQDFPGGPPPQDFTGGSGGDGPQAPGGEGTNGPAITPFPGMGGPIGGPGGKDGGGSPDVKPFSNKSSGPGGGAQGNSPGGVPDIKPAEFPGLGPNGLGNLPGSTNAVAPPSEWGAGDAPGGVQLPDSRGGAPMPPMSGMPMGGGMGGGTGGAPERPDSSGLLDGGVEPWKGGAPPPIGDPRGLDTPSSNPADWAAPGGGKGDQMPGMPGMPMGQGAGMGGAGGGTAAERPDSAGLLDGGVEPWKGGELPGGDPSGVDAPALNPAEWAAPGDVGKGVQSPGMPGMPMGQGVGGAGGGTAAERPDSAGLLDGGVEPWTGADLPGGDPKGVDAPALDPTAWAAPGGDKAVLPSGMPGVPMGSGVGGAGGATAAERPDSAGLLDGGVEPWSGSEVPGGDPSGVDTPTSDPAGWAVPGGGQGAQAAGMPGMPMSPTSGGAGGGPAERPDSAGLLDGGTEPWTGGEVPGGDPSGVDTPTSDPAAWALPGGSLASALLDGGGEPRTGADVPDGVVAPGTWTAPPERRSTPGLPMMPMGQGAVGGNPAERPDSAALLDGGAEPWTGAGPAAGEPAEAEAPSLDPAAWAASHGGTEPGVPLAPGTGDLASIVDGTAASAPGPADRVAVVAPPDGREDTSSWHTGGSGFLTLLWPLGPPKDDHRGEEEVATDYVLRDTEPWMPEADPAEYATWQRKKQGDEFAPPEEAGERRPSCTDIGEAPAVAAEEPAESEEDSDEGEEETPRSMSDLLRQDDSAWGGSNNRPSGVLE
ncbi:hypothetical protein [Amycolatopsis sp. H20-H5]|uniref:hypothetical protein n=1 Tax=Amycolatopsis sp. H20-H5 TaxID=3046309 RepID=UPI002DB606B0|nr:hypothetical protein [Amycolatopsis sp. H20-H5]MEC3980612.1 hypothetical protein [Amycolatopsis sp. H20-H5]